MCGGARTDDHTAERPVTLQIGGRAVADSLSDHLTMHSTSRRTALLLAGLLVFTAGCDRPNQGREPGAVASVAANLPPFPQEIASVKAELTLPGVWKYAYRMVDRPDTMYGAHRAIEFLYTADSAAKVPPRLLLVIRAFKKPVWEKVKESQKEMSRFLAEHDGDVYAFSIVTSNPYSTNTPSALRVDAMMLALTTETSPFRMTFK